MKRPKLINSEGKPLFAMFSEELEQYADHLETQLEHFEAVSNTQAAIISRLEKQASEIVEKAKNLTFLHSCEQEGLESGQPKASEWRKAVEELQEAIQKAEEK